MYVSANPAVGWSSARAGGDGEARRPRGPDGDQLTVRYELICCSHCALTALRLCIETEVKLAPGEDEGDVPPFRRRAMQRPEPRECRLPVCLDAFNAVSLFVFERAHEDDGVGTAVEDVPP